MRGIKVWTQLEGVPLVPPAWGSFRDDSDPWPEPPSLPTLVPPASADSCHMRRLWPTRAQLAMQGRVETDGNGQRQSLVGH